MRHSRGQTRRVTDAQVRMLRAWKPFHELASDIGICIRHARNIRQGKYQHKQKSP